MNIKIIKRNQTIQEYDSNKIKGAIEKSFFSVEQPVTRIDDLVQSVENKLLQLGKDQVSIEEIQDLVEQTLMEAREYKAMKSYILYREDRGQMRQIRKEIMIYFPDFSQLEDVLVKIQIDFHSKEYSLDTLLLKFKSLIREGISLKEKLSLLTQAAIELTSQEAPQWEKIAGRLLYLEFGVQLKENLSNYSIHSFYEKIEYLTSEGLYGSYILDHYSKEEIELYSTYMDEKRNDLLNYSGLELLINRYVIRTRKNVPIETVQEMFLGVAMHLAMQETKDRDIWVRRFYDMLSKLQVTMATPTLSNARKPYHQLSSCFIDTVPDSLDGIYRSLDNFAKVSKFGGGMGLYFGKVRANGSAIRGFEGAAGGVIRWIRLANDTAVAVDQLGMRQGSVAVYLDVWHKDLPEFLNLRTNNGDDRMKAHDVFPAVCYPDYFWQQVKDNMERDWYLMCPHEILTVKGYALEDYFGDEWKEKYLDCVNDFRIHKRVVPIKSIVRLIIKSAVETGTPFTFNRDHVNRMNPNNHQGIIYCSNLCTEIAQNMSEIKFVSEQIKTEDGDTVIVTTTKPGEFVVCNLASLSLGNINVDDEKEIRSITSAAMRALDNVIDLNFFPVPYAKVNNLKYRPVGLGISGYHHMLAKHHIKWESQQHLDFIEEVFSKIHHAAIEASCDNAKEKGAYQYFEGSDWQTGAYFEKRKLNGEYWDSLKEKVSKYGMRNGYLLAIAPTGSTSIIAGTTAGIDPIMNRYFLEEKKKGLLPRVAPDLSIETFWYYKNAHLIDQSWSVKAAGIRQRHIDQAQSMNLYITNDYTYRSVLNLYIQAWLEGVKTIYYIRSKSLEVDECEACSS